MRKKNILYIIDSLAVGGAEMLLSSTLNQLSLHYNITLVYMENKTALLHTFDPRIQTYCLNYTGKKDFFKAVWRLRKIIKDRKIDVINAQLFWSTLVAKFAAPFRVRFVITIQNLMSQDVFDNSKIALFLEKITNRKKQEMIFVTQEALIDYDRQVGIPSKSYIVYNPIQTKYVATDYKVYDPQKGKLRLIAIGNLRKQKNYPFLIETMKLLKEKEIYVDIFGEGDMRPYMESEIAVHGLKITLKGSQLNIHEQIRMYDAFIMTSAFEGYGIAVVEAMASGLPVILSDIPVLREVTNSEALFFNLDDPNFLAGMLSQILEGSLSINEKAKLGQKRAIDIGHIDGYYKNIISIYEGDDKK